MRLILLLYITLMIGSNAFAVDINLKGTVDKNGAVISGAVVSLVSDSSMKDTTSTSGEFTISNITSISPKSKPGNYLQNISSITIKNDLLYFSTGSPVSNGSISIFSCNGVQYATIPFGKLEAGSHSYKLPRLAAGIYVMHLNSNLYMKLKICYWVENTVYGCSGIRRSSRNTFNGAIISIHYW